MNAYQSRKLAELKALLTVCNERGLAPEHLRRLLHETCTVGMPVDSPLYEHERQRAEEISAAGLAAQLSYLRDALGIKRLTKKLKNMGGVLDAIVRHTSATAEELKADVGMDNIDANGDVT
jgi:hypothetical protein